MSKLSNKCMFLMFVNFQILSFRHSVSTTYWHLSSKEIVQQQSTHVKYNFPLPFPDELNKPKLFLTCASYKCIYYYPVGTPPPA